MLAKYWHTWGKYPSSRSSMNGTVGLWPCCWSLLLPLIHKTQFSELKGNFFSYLYCLSGRKVCALTLCRWGKHFKIVYFSCVQMKDIFSTSLHICSFPALSCLVCCCKMDNDRAYPVSLFLSLQGTSTLHALRMFIASHKLANSGEHVLTIHINSSVVFLMWTDTRKYTGRGYSLVVGKGLPLPGWAFVNTSNQLDDSFRYFVISCSVK